MATVSGTTFFGGKVPPAPVAAPQAPATTLSSSIWSQISGAASAGAEQINQGITDIQKGAPNKNPIIGGVEDALKVGSGIASVVSSPIAPVLKPVGDALNAVGNKISDVPAVQKFANSKAGKTTARVAEDLSNAGNITGTILGVDQLAHIPAKIQEMSAAFDKPQTPATPDTNAVQAKTQAKVTSIAKQWQSPIETNKPSFNAARQVLDKAPDTPQFLAEQGIDPSMHIEDGRYATADTAESLRQTAGKLSADTLRPSLQLADYRTPKTPVSDIVAKAVQQISQDKGTTPNDIQTAIAQITKEGDALKAKYPDGMSLTDMHDNKITFAQNAGYSPIKDPAVNLKATANRTLGNVLGDTVEQKAPKEVPVGEFNSYLSKYYKAADYLDALQSKTAPTTILQDAMRFSAKYGGAAIGAKFGGGVVSAFAGYSIGKALEHALENIKSPMRAEFLNNLQHTNPEAFTSIQKYLSGGGNTLQLPAPSAIQLPSESVRPITGRP